MKPRSSDMHKPTTVSNYAQLAYFPQKPSMMTMTTTTATTTTTTTTTFVGFFLFNWCWILQVRPGSSVLGIPKKNL